MAGETILIVEDERSFAQVVEGYLKRLGYRVAGIVDNGDDALTAVNRSRPDLALMDIEIHGDTDGLELADTFLKQHGIPVIFLTGRSDDETLERVRRSESFGYLLKPFRPEELKAGVELALIRHGHEAHLKRVEQSFSAAVISTGDAILLTDTARVVSFLNPAAERLTGWPLKKAVGQELGAVFKLKGESDLTDRLFQTASKGAFVHEATLLTGAGRELPVEVNVSIVRDAAQRSVGSVLVFRDISERKRFEAELKRNQEQLRSLAAHMESVREAERTRIAREIHDEFGQTLTGFKFDLSWLDKKLSTKPETPPEELLEKVRAMKDLLAMMVKSVRRISAELRPGVLDDLGLVAAVEWQANDFQTRTGVKAQVKSKLSGNELPREIATALFRVLQESLTNVARHAKAKNVRVELQQQGDNVILEINDDGRGITPEERDKPRAFGLLGMRERVLPLGGQCEIRGAPGRGTNVRVTVPLGATNTSVPHHD